MGVRLLKFEIGRDKAGNATSPTRVGASEAGTGGYGKRVSVV